MSFARMIAWAAVLSLASALSGCGARLPGTREGAVYRVGDKARAGESDAALMKAAGLKGSDYRLEESERDGAVVRTYYLEDRPADARKAMARIAASIEELRAALGSLRLGDVTARLGRPDELSALDFGQRGTMYNAYYGNVDFCAVGEDAAILEIRIENSGKPAAPTPYKYKSALGIGSRIEDVFAVLGAPRGKAEFELSPENLDRILQTAKGRDLSYIAYLGEGVRFFSSGGLVDAMYFFRPDPSLKDSAPRPSPEEEARAIAAVSSAQAARDKELAAENPPPSGGIEAYADIRDSALAESSSPRDERLMRSLTFSSRTRFLGESAALARRILEAGKNPGLGVRDLHASGITGEGVLVGIIDQNLAGAKHPEYAGKIVKYKDLGTGQAAGRGSMHGPAVLSLLVGSGVGTAPGARVYYAAAPSWTKDAAYQAKALDWIVEESAKLPEGKGIRVVSVSAAPSGPGSPFDKNNEDWDRAVERARAKGILVLDCTQPNGRIFSCWYDPEDPEDPAKCKPGFPGTEYRSSYGKLLAPASYRAMAEAYSAESSEWQYTGRGGLSWSIPWAAGVLALGWQVDPSLSPDRIMALLESSARASEDGSKIIDPRAFIEAARAP